MCNISELTARQKFILNTILEKPPLNSKELSLKFGVSDRTILREVSAINKVLKAKDISVCYDKLKFSIEGKKQEISYLKKSLGSIPVQWLFNQEQRIVFITMQLLLANQPYKLAFFSYQLNVVEGTISFYMDKIEQWLSARYLTLVRKRGYGIIIEGSEWIKRNCFMELVYELKPIDELCAYVYGTQDDLFIHTFFKILFGDKLISTSKKLFDFLEKRATSMDDITYLSSLIHVLLALKKNELGSPIKLPSYLIEDILLSKIHSSAYEMKEYLTSLGIVLADSELTYITIYVLGNKYIYTENKKFEEFGVSFEDISMELVHQVSKKLHVKINCDGQLILGLSQHFNSVLYRVNMDMPIKNSMLDQIKDYYNELFKAVSYACKLVFSKYNINISQDEIGFITMHIGAAIERSNRLDNNFSMLIICPNGMGTARILSNKLKLLIKNIKSIDIQSFKDWENCKHKYDIVLSTVNINSKQKSKKDHIITVSPFLQKEDIDKINNYMAKLHKDDTYFNKISLLSKSVKYESSEEQKYEMIDNLLNNMRIETIEPQSFKKMIELIAKDEYDHNIINNKEDIQNLIINREKLGSVVIPNSQVALLHTRSDCVVSPFIGVYRLKKYMKLRSIGFAYEDVDTFIVLLARKSEQSYVLEQMGNISICLIEDKNFTEILRFGNIMDLRSKMLKILKSANQDDEKQV
ncbi:BglG family transcription antiterminator [Clostridium ljungdahlii]|uniref:Transcriptional regulator MtlR n=1 Tax=Clostridium ljungdahlii TaxID=1538 RepID=A0A162NE97_9CLOT|nr:BglG family transcription antiterminator [Clostridium ljungdahlii]OAA92399.1 Transcriptional regulator MtlR [Clostridium ljungdahlii]